MKKKVKKSDLFYRIIVLCSLLIAIAIFIIASPFIFVVDKSNLKEQLPSIILSLVGGIIFMVPSIIIIIKTIKHENKTNSIIANGIKAKAIVDRYMINYDINYRKQNPYCIYCHINDNDGKKLNFYLENLWFDLSIYNKKRLTIDVYYLKEDPSKFYLDPLSIEEAI